MTTKPHCDADLTANGAGFEHFRRRCSSLDWRLLHLVFGSLALLSVLVAGAFAVAGAWLIIPFAGLEIVALGVAAWWTLRRADDFERLTFVGDRILLDVKEQGLSRHFEFNRCWARLVTGHAGAVALRSHGREVAIGRFCGEESRQELAREVRSRLGGHRI